MTKTGAFGTDFSVADFSSVYVAVWLHRSISNTTVYGGRSGKAGHVIILKKGWSSSLFCLKNHIVLQVEFRVETVYLGLGTVTLLLYFLLFICTDEDEEARQKKKDATKEKVKCYAILPLNLIIAEYAKSGRSSCKKCSEKIESKSLRLGFCSWDPQGNQSLNPAYLRSDLLQENVAFLRNIILDDRVPANELKFLLRSLNYLGSLLEKSDTLKEKTLLPDQSKFYSGERYIYQYTCPGEDQEECVIRTRVITST
ncbi:haloacid dehalogenase-like domain-containing protein [Tanacetum coccineum]